MKRKLLIPLLGLIVILIVGSAFLLINHKNSTAKDTTLLQTPYEQDQFLLGTYVRIKVYDKDKGYTTQMAMNLVERLEKTLEVTEDGESQIDLVNEMAGIKPVKVNGYAYEILKEAIKYSRDPNVGFDVAIGPLTNLWHIGFDDARKPSQGEIDEALKLVNAKYVKFDDKKQTIYLEKKGMLLDLGAISKGYITDKVVELLKSQGVTSAIVDLGGNIDVIGHSPRGADTPWTIGIQDPTGSRGTSVGYVTGKDKSYVTSGIYERYLEIDGIKYHHILNPKTGYPYNNNIAGVSIITNRSIDGDALSTTVFTLGITKGYAYIEKNKNAEAIFITKDKKIILTSGIKDNFRLDKDSGYKVVDIKDIKD